MRDVLSVFATKVFFFQFVRNRLCFIALRVFLKYLPNDGGFCFIDVILFVLQVPTEDVLAARSVSFEPAFAQTAVDLLPQIFGEVFVEAFDDGEEQLSLGCIGDVFHCGNEFHPVVRQFLAVDDGFILVTGESVELVNDDHAPLTFFAVAEHSLKIRPIVVGARRRSVDIFIHDKQIVFFRKLLADADLSFDGLLCLTVR